MNNNKTPNPAPASLEEIALRKAELLQQIQVQKQVMAELAQEIFAPAAPAVGRANGIMRMFSMGMSVFNGVRWGMKVMQGVKSLFGKKGKRS